ncbi:hypothetical protein V8D89_008935 [Ganoderma adspersum]
MFLPHMFTPEAAWTGPLGTSLSTRSCVGGSHSPTILVPLLPLSSLWRVRCQDGTSHSMAYLTPPCTGILLNVDMPKDLTLIGYAFR